MIQRIFLGRNEPAVTAAARLLSSQDTISLSRSLIIVPTRASSIKLTHELVRLSPHQAVILPKITTADKLIQSFLPDSTQIATPNDSLAAWAKVLISINTSHYPFLFGKLTLIPDFSWACSCGEQFLKTQNILAESGYSFTSLAEIFNDADAIKKYDLGALLPPGEASRWKELASLESLVLNKIHSWNRIDHNEAIINFLNHPFPRPEYNQVILLCHPDPLPFIFPLLNSWMEQGAQVSTWIHSDEALSDGFDPYGRPVVSYWEKNLIPIPEGDNCIHILQDPASLAKKAVQHIASEGMNSNEIALGVCDESFTPFLEQALNNAGWKSFNAAGYKTTGTIWQRLLNLLHDSFTDQEALPPLLEAVSSPLIQDSLQFESPYDLLLELDKVREQHLPESIEYMETLLSETAKKDFRLLREWFEEWRTTPFCARMQAFLEKIRLNDLLEEYQTPAFDLLLESIKTIAPLEEEGILSNQEEVLYIVQQCFLKQTAYEDPIPTDISLDNWLELPFSPEPHLILAAFHEGKVPDNAPADPFLPEKLRNKLNLRGTAQRMARDAFLLDGMLNSRRSNGSAHIFLSKQDAKGDPCLPSSLLMRCSESELPERVRTLFPKEIPPLRRPSATRGDWFLSNPETENPWSSPTKAFSPSLLKEFLTCPLRFWLKKIHGFERLELESSAQAYQLGNIIHKVMEKLGDPAIASSSDKYKVQNLLLDAFDAAFNEQFGTTRSLPLTLQYEYGQRRMKAVAREHIRNVLDGWQVLETEKEVRGWELYPGFLLNMRLDCLMGNDNNDILIVDYKTSKKAKTPKDAHLKSISSKKALLMENLIPSLPLLEEESAPPSRRITTYRWLDLQLPLYKLWAKSHFKDNNIQVGYFNIPLNLDAVELSLWRDLDEKITENAADCALSIMNIIRKESSGKLPSAELLGWDIFPNDPFLKLGDDGLELAFNLNDE